MSNLCSAYSYCITALDAVYVWHGRGTTQTERESAATNARTIAGPEKDIEEFEEGKEDPMFFMLLGEDPWANADYWKYRSQLAKTAVRPRMFIVDARDKKQPVRLGFGLLIGSRVLTTLELGVLPYSVGEQGDTRIGGCA